MGKSRAHFKFKPGTWAKVSRLPFSRVNYSLPNPTIFIATADGGAAYNPTAGAISTALSPRQLQWAVKLVF